MEAFLASLSLVALAEMGDKTQLLAILLAARLRKPVPIIAGILVATLANHFLAALLGQQVAGLIDSPAFRYAIAAGFIGMALWALIPDKFDEDDAPKDRSAGVFVTTLPITASAMGPSGAAISGPARPPIPSCPPTTGTGSSPASSRGTEARGLASIGPVEARVDGIQAPTAAMQDAGLAVRTGGMRLPGGAIAAATATADVRGVVRADDSAVALVGTVDGFADRPTLAGPLRVTPGVFATAGARQPLGADPPAPAAFAEAGAHADVGLPAWRATATAFERLEPGVDVRWTPVRAAEQPAIGVVPYLQLWEHGGSTDAGARIAWDAGLTWTGYATRHGATAWAQGSTSGLYLGPSAAGFAAHHGALDSSRASWIYAQSDAIRQPDPSTPKVLDQTRLDGALTLPGPLSSVRMGGARPGTSPGASSCRARRRFAGPTRAGPGDRRHGPIRPRPGCSRRRDRHRIRGQTARRRRRPGSARRGTRG